MANMTLTFYSKELMRETNIQVLLPDMGETWRESPGKKKYPVLYLLHGLGGNETDWIRKTSLERYAADRQVILVMPNGETGFYTDTAYHMNYFTFLTEELPWYLKNWLPISEQRDHTFIAGLSMGGYGALKAALTNPDRYAAAAFFSAALEPEHLEETFPNEEEKPFVRRNIETIFGTLSPLPPAHDLYSLLETDCRGGKKLPFLIHYIGTEDFLYEMNQRFERYAKDLGVPILYEEWSGAHEWQFWDLCIKKTLDLLFPV